MSYAFRAAGTIVEGTTTSVPNAHVPSSVQAGDALFFVVAGSVFDGPTPYTLSLTGWTKIADTQSTNVHFPSAVWYKVATVSDANALIQTDDPPAGASNLTAWAAQVVAYSGTGTYRVASAAVANPNADPNHPNVGVAAPAMSSVYAGILIRVWTVAQQSSTGTLSAVDGSLAVRGQSVSDAASLLFADQAWSTLGDAAESLADSSYPYPQMGLGVTISLADNVPPNTAAWSSPADAAVLDRSVDQVLTPDPFSDPDPGDSQSKISWRVSSDGGVTWTTTTTATVTPTITIPGGTLAAGSYQFQLKFADQSGTFAVDWSPSLHLTFADAPSAPTITEPTSGGTVAATNVLAWSFPDQQQYEARKVADNAGTADPSTIYYDTGNVTDANTRQVTLTNDTNNRWEHQQVRCTDSTGLWSTWADVRVDVTFDPPPTSTVTITEDPDQGRIVVTLTTSSPGDGEVAAVTATLEARPVGATVTEWSRSGTDVALNGDTVFWTPASGVDYEVRATTFGDSGSTAATGWIGSATGTPDDDAPLLDGGTPSTPEGVLV